MLALKRPPKPAGFDQSVTQARADIEAILQHGDPKSTDFDAKLWQKHKRHFSDAQYGKCGYCEHDTRVSYYGDVEHYAPKAGVDRFRRDVGSTPPHKPGAQTPAYPIEPLHKRGYYWLAYEWTNYLYACAICNQTHKRALFPLACGNERPLDPGESYEALLLDPYDAKFVPSEHLGFDEFGFIFDAQSQQGWETIRTCRLDRTELQQAREPNARRAKRYVEILLRAVHDGSRKHQLVALRELAELGQARLPFAGMVRIMAEHSTRQSWARLMEWRDALEAEV